MKRGRRGRGRGLFLLGLVCCSPVLLPLVFLSFPLVCVLALCVRFGPGASDAGSCPKRREEEAAPPGEGGAPLLQRYLEDQLGLVGYCCGDEDDGGDAGEGC